MDGMACVPFPSNMTSTPVEIWEVLTSTMIEKKAVRPDSGGPGRGRGGAGQGMVIRNDSGYPMPVACLGARTEFPPLGLHEGGPGQRREYRINGSVVHPKGRYVLQPGDTIATTEPGGGGLGDPRERAAERVFEDVRAGLVTVEGALRDYGVVVDLAARRAWRSKSAAAT